MAMKFKYVRIQGTELAENTMYAKGIFSMCVQLARNDVMDAEDKELFQEIDSWIAEVLPFPPQCRRQENVVCFFKTEKETEMMRMIHPLMWLLENTIIPSLWSIPTARERSSMRTNTRWQ